MINRKLISDFADIIGNLTIAIHLNTLASVSSKYKIILNELLSWVCYYYENKNFDVITYDNSLKIHDLLKDIRNKLISDKEIGMEAMLADNILIRYEVIIKTINV